MRLCRQKTSLLLHVRVFHTYSFNRCKFYLTLGKAVYCAACKSIPASCLLTTCGQPGPREACPAQRERCARESRQERCHALARVRHSGGATRGRKGKQPYRADCSKLARISASGADELSHQRRLCAAATAAVPLFPAATASVDECERQRNGHCLRAYLSRHLDFPS